MKKKKPKINPFCPIRGCQTKKLHADDPIVKALIELFSSPVRMTGFSLAAMSELKESVCRDLLSGKIFAWHSRLRQPEELYLRTLYALFIATDQELPHVLSGDMPNGLSQIYEKVNAEVFQGRGTPQKDHAGLNFDIFKPMEMLHDSAHATFRGLMTCFGLVKNPENLRSPEVYCNHLTSYCNNLDYMNGMFKAGKAKEDVLAGVRNLHRP